MALLLNAHVCMQGLQRVSSFSGCPSPVCSVGIIPPVPPYIHVYIYIHIYIYTVRRALFRHTSNILCVYAFMRLWGGLIFRNQLSFGFSFCMLFVSESSFPVSSVCAPPPPPPSIYIYIYTNIYILCVLF